MFSSKSIIKLRIWMKSFFNYMLIIIFILFYFFWGEGFFFFFFWFLFFVCSWVNCYRFYSFYYTVIAVNERLKNVKLYVDR